MTLRDGMRTGLRKVVDAFGETWQYRTISSAPGVSPVTYGSWANVTAHLASRTIVNEYDSESRVTARHERSVIRIKDTVTLGEFDQVKDPDSVIYAVGGAVGETVLMSGIIGTTAYRIGRLIQGLAGEHRGGGG